MADDVEVQLVQPGSRVDDAEKRHKFDGHCCWEKNRAEVTAELAQKKRAARRVKSLDFDAPINADVVVGADDAASEGKSIPKGKRGLKRDTDALVFQPSRSSQTTDDLAVVTKGKSVAQKPSYAMADVAGTSAHPVPLQVLKTATRSHASVVPSYDVVDENALRTHIQELHAKNKDLLARHTGNQKLYMDML